MPMYTVKRWNLETAAMSGHEIEIFAGHRRFAIEQDAVDFAEAEKDEWDRIVVFEGRVTDKYPDQRTVKSFHKGKSKALPQEQV